MLGAFRLACRNVWLLSKRKTFLFVLLLSGCLFANFYSVYLLSSTIGDIRESSLKLETEKVIRIDCSTDQSMVDREAVMQKLEEAGYSFNSSFVYRIPDEDVSSEARHAIDNLFLIQVDSIDEKITGYFIKNGRYLSQEDINDSLEVCCVSSQFFDFGEALDTVGSQMVLNGKTVAVAGILSDANYEFYELEGSFACITVPYSIVDASIYPLYSVELTTGEEITESDKEEIQNIIDDFAPNAEINWPKRVQQTSLWSKSVQLVLTNVSIITVALTNVLAVLVAWIEMNRVNLYMTYVCGASKGVLHAFVALQALLIDLMSLPFVLVIYRLTAKLRVWGQIPYEPSTVEKVLIFAGVAVIFMAITLIRSHSVIQNIEEQKGRL